MRVTRALATDGRIFRAVGDRYHVTGSPVVAKTPAPTAPPPTGVAPALARILRPQAAYRWMLPSLAAITPQYIEMVLRSALAGNHVQQWELFDLMLDSWPELAACAQELRDGVSCLKMIFEPFAEEDEDPTPSAVERCKLASSALRRMQPDAAADENDLEGTVNDIIDGWFRGVTALETDWQAITSSVHGTILAPRCTFWVHPVCFGWDQSGRLGLRMDANGVLTPSSLGMSSQAQPAMLGAFPPHKFLLGIHKAKSGTALGGALLRPLAWWWCAANFSADWLLNLAQIFGLPFRWANYDPTAPQETVDRICAMLQNMGSAGWAAFPTGTTLELKDAGKTGDHSPQGELLDRADRYARLLILGQTMSGSQDASKGGGKAFGSVESDVKKKRIEAAGRYACRVLNTQLLPAVLTLNYGDADECPQVRLLEDKEGGLEEAQRDQILAQIMPLSKTFLRKKYGQPEPQDEDDEAGGEPEPEAVPGKTRQPDGEFEGEGVKALAALCAIEDDAVFARELSALVAGEGELRDELGRWTADPSAGTITPDEARSRLTKGIDTKDVLGNPARFDGHVLEHWAAQGHPQEEQDRRLRRLPDAVAAVEAPHEVWQSDKQTVHLRSFIDDQSKQRYTAGFIMENGKARTFFHVNRAKDAQKFRKGKRLYARP